MKDHSLVGAVAAMSTKSNKVGFVGGMKSDLISKFENGFKVGCKGSKSKH